MNTFESNWSDIYHMLEDTAFDYSKAMRIGEDSVLVDGTLFYSLPF